MPEAPDPYWTDDTEIGHGHFWRSDFMIRLKAHVSTERYRERKELVPGIQPSGDASPPPAAPESPAACRVSVCFPYPRDMLANV